MKEKEITGIKIWKILLIFIIIVLIPVVYIYINKPKKELSKNININYDNQIINNLNFEKIKIYSKNKKYYFIAKVKNNNNYDINITPINVTLKGNKKISFISYAGDVIKTKEYKIITMETKEDLSGIKKIIFSFNQK